MTPNSIQHWNAHECLFVETNTSRLRYYKGDSILKNAILKPRLVNSHYFKNVKKTCTILNKGSIPFKSGIKIPITA